MKKVKQSEKVEEVKETIDDVVVHPPFLISLQNSSHSKQNGGKCSAQNDQ